MVLIALVQVTAARVFFYGFFKNRRTGMLMALLVLGLFDMMFLQEFGKSLGEAMSQ